MSYHRPIHFINNILTDFQKDILESQLLEKGALHTAEEIISWLTALKTCTDLDVIRCNIDDLDQWNVGEWEISHIDQKFFKVIGVEANIGNREILSWCQPLIEQRQSGVIGFILKKINNIYHLLVQAKLEAGNFDILEMAPTVQCITGNYQQPDWMIHYLEFFTKKKENVVIRYDQVLSEEGGRFYHEENRYIVVEVDNNFPIIVLPNYIWMTFCQAKELIKYNNYFNIEARSLIACVTVV